MEDHLVEVSDFAEVCGSDVPLATKRLDRAQDAYNVIFASTPHTITVKPSSQFCENTEKTRQTHTIPFSSSTDMSTQCRASIAPVPSLRRYIRFVACGLIESTYATSLIFAECQRDLQQDVTACDCECTCPTSTSSMCQSASWWACVASRICFMVTGRTA